METWNQRNMPYLPEVERLCDYFSWKVFFVQTIVWVRLFKQQLQGTTLLYSFHGRLGLPGISTSPWWVSTNPWLPKSITAPTSHGHYPLAVKNAICAVFNGKPILMCCWKWWQLTRSKTCRERLFVICPISCASWLWLYLCASNSRIRESRPAPATKNVAESIEIRGKSLASAFITVFKLATLTSRSFPPEVAPPTTNRINLKNGKLLAHHSCYTPGNKYQM